MMEEKFVTYEAFGAVGDGKTDDMPAIVAAHEYANTHGLPVRVKSGATYYIGGRDLTAHIRTDTDFADAQIIIDDSVPLENRSGTLFAIDSEHDFFDVTVEKLDREQKKLDLPHEGNLYVQVYDDDKRVYIRYGSNANNGTAQQDCFTLDPDGNIGSYLPWQFDQVTRARAKSIDDTPITISGGTFITIANRDPRERYSYHNRGITCTRSHTYLHDVHHLVRAESEVQGSPYIGFFYIKNCADVVLKDCLFTPHRTYYWTMENGVINAYGTYDFGADSAIGIQLLGMRQSIDIMDRRYWGLMGTNFCKDMVLRDCKISRFDAHQGVINMTLQNCEFGHVKMEVIGFGQALIEGCKLHGSFFMLLRDDYGSFFKGNLTVRNCEWEILPDNKKGTFFKAYNNGTHDFGYVCEMPRHIVFENLLIDDTKAPADYEGTFIFNTYDPHFRPDRAYPYVVPETVTLKNVRTLSPRGYKLFEDERLFAGVKVTEE